MPSLKERIEQNLTVWLLSTLLTGFLAGFGAYKAIQEIGGLTPVSKNTLESMQKNITALEISLVQTTQKLDSLKKIYAIEQENARHLERRSADAAGRAVSSLKNIRINIIHSPAQIDAATRLAGQLEGFGAITTTSSLNYDRSYWCISSRVNSDKALMAATQIKSQIPELGVLPLKQMTAENGVYDLAIWLHNEYR